MRVFSIHRNVMCGQCKGALLRLQVGYTAIFLFPGLLPGWAGSRVGLFTPRKVGKGFACLGFYFLPWLAPDVATCLLPKWYRWATRAVSFRLD